MKAYNNGYSSVIVNNEQASVQNQSAFNGF